MAATQTQDADTPAEFILCPACGANVAAPVRPELTNDPLYQKAYRIHLGFHRWHSRMKWVSFACLGFAIWVNDLCDRVMRLLCTYTTETVDAATQSFAWRWTIGFFTPPVPTVTHQVSHLYDWYSGGTSVLLFAGVMWLSRWIYWTGLLDDFRINKVKEHSGAAAFMAFAAILFWCVEYAALGLTARYAFGPKWPTSIPVLPDWTGWLAFGLAFFTVVMLDYLQSSAGSSADANAGEPSEG